MKFNFPIAIFIVAGIVVLAFMINSFRQFHQLSSGKPNAAEERIYREVSLKMNLISIASTMVLAIASASIAWLVYEYQSNANIMGSSLIWVLPSQNNLSSDFPAEESKRLQFTIEIYNNGGAPALINEIKMQNKGKTTLILASSKQPHNSVTQIVSETFVDFSSNRVLGPGTLTRFMFYVEEDDARIDDILRSTCIVECIDGAVRELSTDSVLTASTTSTTYLSMAPPEEWNTL